MAVFHSIRGGQNKREERAGDAPTDIRHTIIYTYNDAYVVLSIRVSSSIQEQPHHGQVTPLSGEEEGSL